MRLFRTLGLASVVVTAAVLTSQMMACGGQPAKKNACSEGNMSALSKCAPRPSPVTGIEVSSDNGDVDWKAVKSAGYAYGVARVTLGTTKDKKFGKNWVKMKEAGVVRAPAHWYEPTIDAKKQAEAFMENLDLSWWDLGFKYGKLTPGDLPAVLYLEVQDGVAPEAIVSGAQTWLQFVEKRTKLRPMVLATPRMAGVLKATLTDYPLWFAESATTATPAECPEMPATWSAWKWSFWSSGAEADVAGVPNGPVYTNVFNGALAEMKAMTFPTAPQSGDAGARDGAADSGWVWTSDAGARDGGDAGTSTGDAGTTPPEPPADPGAPPDQANEAPQRGSSSKARPSASEEEDPCAAASKKGAE